MGALTFLYLTQEEVAACGGADMRRTVEDVEEVFRLIAAGDYVLPFKVVLRWGGVETEATRGRINAMPGYIGGRYRMGGIKWIAGFPANPSRHGLPRAAGVIVLNDPERGVPLAVMDGTLISAMRTGAVTGVAAKYLARQEAKVGALVGAGVQSRTQLLALQVALPRLREIRVYDVQAEKSQAFAEEMRRMTGLQVRAAASLDACLDGAEVVVTATTSRQPFLRASQVPPGSLVSQVGGMECHQDVVLQADKVVVDNLDQLVHRGAQTLAQMVAQGRFPRERLHAELPEVVSGRKPGRQTSTETIFFGSVGMGIEDVACATRVYREAQERGAGQRLKLWDRPFAM
ncbi:MAG: hypothetical protein K6T75_06730 [Acetobacteraceae bacterium]|nr:hypothetical protein [Acetobacteraceae bacterium]